MASRTLLSPGKQTNWNTPVDLFNKLNDMFHFTIDIAADQTNALCAQFFDEEHSFFDNIDGIHPWDVLWCNPPYGRNIIKWVSACAKLAERGVQSVMLLPARTDTQWFHKFVYAKDFVHIDFLCGRLKFRNPETGKSDVPAAFPSMLVRFEPVAKTFSQPFMVGPWLDPVKKTWKPNPNRHPEFLPKESSFKE